MVNKHQTCRNCGTHGSMVHEQHMDRNVRWRDGRLFNVQAWRCLACMAMESIARDAVPEDHKPQKGVYSPTDGLRHVVAEITKG